MCFVINNKNQLTTNSCIHNKNTRQLNNIHQPRPNLSKYLKVTSYLGIKVHNNLPSCINDKTDNPKKVQNQFKKNFTLTLFLLYSILRNNQQMQLYAVNFIPLLGSLYMFRVFYTPIIRSTIFNCFYSHWYKP